MSVETKKATIKLLNHKIRLFSFFIIDENNPYYWRIFHVAGSVLTNFYPFLIF